MNADTRNAWGAFSRALLRQGHYPQPSLHRRLRLSAWARDRVPHSLRGRCIDLHARGVAGSPAWYNVNEVTGLDFVVQASLVVNTAAVDAMREAFHYIEDHDIDDFAFLCLGGTHRSVGCCFLLAALVYPGAEISLTTPRTCANAVQRGLLPSTRGGSESPLLVSPSPQTSGSLASSP